MKIYLTLKEINFPNTAVKADKRLKMSDELESNVQRDLQNPLCVAVIASSGFTINVQSK